MHDKIQRAKSERLLEATRNDFVGLEGKFGTILKYLGKPIIATGGSLFESSFLDDPYEEENNEMPTFDEDQSIMEVGYIFDGLSSGIHLEIKYILEKQELTVYHKGFMVFAEIAGELECYVPNSDWESHIDTLYKHAKIREKKKQKEQVVENKQEFEREKEKLLDVLKVRWGI